jgi:hypothetical protein
VKHAFIHLAVALFALGCGSSRPAGPGSPGDPAGGGGAKDAPAVKIAAPAEGTSALESRSIEMSFELTLIKDGSPAGIQGGSWSIYEERTLKVGATKGNAIEKLEIAFGRREAKALLGVEKPSTTAGKTYLVEAPGGVKLAGGKDAPEAERAPVAAEYGWVGEPSPLLAELARLSTGGRSAPSAAARRALIGELPGVDHEKTELSVVLAGVESGKRPTAKLDVELKTTLDNGDVLFDLELAGPARIDTETGWVASLELDGKLTAKGAVKHQKKTLEAKGKGSVKIVRKAEFR